VAAALVESGRARHVLLVQSHVVSPTLDLDQPASAIFGDAASALVVGPGAPHEGLVGDVAASDGALHRAVSFERQDGGPWWAGGPALHPASADRAATETMTSRLLHFGVDTVRALLDRTGTTAAEVDVLATIQPAAWYPSALAEALGVPVDRAPCTFGSIAHVGACGVVANLLAARRSGHLAPGARVVLYAHGAGMNRVAALLRWGSM
jgi:3-oxoacyl-[acyl-carrier-protein] synthase-3